MIEVDLINKILNNIQKVIIGKQDEITNVLKAVIAGGHVLIEDVPGVGKTTLVKALARSLSLNYSRIQFTPDLSPSDIIGISIYDQKSMEFQFNKGPIFSNIVLADEINRTSPKTQSALLEVMEEYQVSEGNDTYKVETPFFVLATQNPIEYEGTFSLPEAQLDRFMIMVRLGYPSKESEKQILKLYKEKEPFQYMDGAINKEELLYLQKQVRKVKVNDKILDYMVAISEATRNSKYLSLGVSTRAVMSLQRIGQASALIKGRDYVIPEDIRENVSLVLSHRIILSSKAVANGYNKENMISDIVKDIEVPKVTM
ncbi:methanol dehydrogenase regulatory protein (moxR) [Clostridium putrefaciens]|uniref:Methanol dehydrogenase regulatory protein (MoxR) n=1 Tax=Clostridium putrefaciens TaxID=99675 RepID=A0A381J7U7_9CLOT|nr:MoxR family ATPase [Clostridium putrefaciens]SUY46413.1 methanol dehydrogenase regulatory protein (moxR) [Clostridium putrefaciens]